MSTPLTATGRIVLPYVYDGLTHKIHAYVRNPQLVGGDWMINSRTTDANDTHWYDAAHALAEAVSYIVDDTDQFSDATLETYASGVWTPRESTTNTNAHGTGTPQPATQLTLTLRDTVFAKIKVIVMEGTQVPPQHWTTYLPAGTDALSLFNRQFTPDYTIGTPPYIWMVGRGNHYINTSPFVAETMTLNRKIRRARGYV